MPEATSYTPADRLYAWYLGNPNQPQLLGTLSLVQGNRGVALQYASSWLQTGFPLSEDLPLLPELFVPHQKDTAVGAIDDARPDRWGERVIRKFERTPRLSLLEYLYFAGDERYGALGVSPSSAAYQPWPTTPLPQVQDLHTMAEVVRQVLANEPVPERLQRLIRPGVSLGGARPKSLLQMDGEAWLVKFSEGEDMDTELIEHATMTLARLCGIHTAATRALPLPQGRHAVAVRRFDRTRTQRLHAVSANVALTAAGEPLGYPQFAQLLRRLAPAQQIAAQQEQLFRRMVFNILVDNTDDHEKNHALLRQPDGSYLLTPAFDVVPSAQGLGYQAMLVGQAGAESTLDNALSHSQHFGLKLAQAQQIVQSIQTVVAGWHQHFQGLGVKKSDLDALAPYLQRQR